MYLERMTTTTMVPRTNQNTKLRKASSSGNKSRNEGNLKELIGILSTYM